MQGFVGYLQRLNPDQRRQVQEDMACLTTYAKQQKWSKDLLHALKTLLADFGLDEA
jgi:hypothetical protein